MDDDEEKGKKKKILMSRTLLQASVPPPVPTETHAFQSFWSNGYLRLTRKPHRNIQIKNDKHPEFPIYRDRKKVYFWGFTEYRGESWLAFLCPCVLILNDMFGNHLSGNFIRNDLNILFFSIWKCGRIFKIKYFIF